MNNHLNCNDIVTLSTLHMFSRYNDYIKPPDKNEERNHINNPGEKLTPTQTMILPPSQFGVTYNCNTPTQFGVTYNVPTLAFTPPSGMNARRSRGEKKPIPENLKDDRYFERRKRNNQAAKKSRDARRMREDQIAFRASILEQENALLRAQILTLREEAHSLRQLLLLQRKANSYVCLPTNTS